MTWPRPRFFYIDFYTATDPTTSYRFSHMGLILVPISHKHIPCDFFLLRHSHSSWCHKLTWFNEIQRGKCNWYEQNNWTHKIHQLYTWNKRSAMWKRWTWNILWYLWNINTAYRNEIPTFTTLEGKFSGHKLPNAFSLNENGLACVQSLSIHTIKSVSGTTQKDYSPIMIICTESQYDVPEL